jgi:PAS domain S-box-containing protein
MENEANFSEKFMMVEKFLNELSKLSHLVHEVKLLQMQVLKLEEDTNNYKTILTNIPQGVSLKDKNSTYIFCNKVFAQHIRVRLEEVAGKTDFDLFPEEVAKKIISEDKRIMQQEESDVNEDKYRIDGQDKIIRYSRIPHKNGSGEVVGLITIMEDNTERYQKDRESIKSNEELAKVRNQYNNEIKIINDRMKEEISARDKLIQKNEMKNLFLFDNNPLAQAIIDDNFFISQINTKFEDIFGLKKSEVENKLNWNEFIASDSFINNETKVKVRLSFGENNGLEKAQDGFKIYFIDEQRDVKDILLNVSKIPESRQWLIALSDISFQKKMRNEIGNLAENIKELFNLVDQL